MQVSATTATGKAFKINGLVKKDGRTYAFDVNTAGWDCNVATNVSLQLELFDTIFKKQLRDFLILSFATDFHTTKFNK